tara:strand:- start:169 stop:816 length:648 start_codon:yes stop_codon:yes gene_type:complete
MIKLGISLRVVKAEKYDEKRDALSHDWPILLEKLGIIPVYIPNILSDLKEFLKNTDVNCLLLSGGDNIGDNPERDTSEKNIIEYGINNKIPILGVCRGMQSLNNFFGGSVDKNRNSNHVGRPHSVKISNTFLQSLFESNSINVNSYHNNVITKENLSKQLTSFAEYEMDQTIEGFFHKKYPIMGVMWHPERNPDNTSELILSRFFCDNEFWKKII